MWLELQWRNFSDQFYDNFIKDNRWRYMTNGLVNTLTITVVALALGLAIGFVIAYIRVTHDNTGKLRPFNSIARLYLTVIRGTPALVQLLFIYFVIFANSSLPKILVAALSFGINSGAYIAEIFRGGMMSVDKGQSEAGRSLGLNYGQTMWRIIMPQAVKNALPALGNEFITLLKETSIAGFVAVQELTKGADIIRSRTYNAFMPLTAAAVIYLGIVLILEKLLGALEGRLRRSDHR
ncbi:MAG: amino acid ABC transporter permease [Oscillospiraceae bacterium]|nr:amino acid ABC transporter permease [Oscillospiraceae bacterium]